MAGALPEQGDVAGLFHVSFRIRLEMRAVGFPAALVLSGTVQQRWGQGEVCKSNYRAAHTASFTSLASLQVSSPGVFPSELESSSFSLMNWFLVNSIVPAPAGTRVTGIQSRECGFLKWRDEQGCEIEQRKIQGG